MNNNDDYLNYCQEKERDNSKLREELEFLKSMVEKNENDSKGNVSLNKNKELSIANQNNYYPRKNLSSNTLRNIENRNLENLHIPSGYVQNTPNSNYNDEMKRENIYYNHSFRQKSNELPESYKNLIVFI